MLSSIQFHCEPTNKLNDYMNIPFVYHHCARTRSYRSVNVRLRKMNRPEEDISAERLKMRTNIESEIDRVLVTFGFERVLVVTKEAAGDSIKDDSSQVTRTRWNRNLQIYRRKEI